MKAKSIFSLFLGIVFFGSIIFAAAQNEGVQEKQRRRTRDNITTLMLLRMTRFLELSEEQTVKIYPFFTRIEKEKAEINQQIRKHMQDLRMNLREEDPDPKVLKDGIQVIKKTKRSSQKQGCGSGEPSRRKPNRSPAGEIPDVCDCIFKRIKG